MHLRNEEREKNSKYWDRCSRTFYLSRGTNWFIRIERRPNFEFVIVVGSVGFRRSFAANRYRVVPLICQCLPLRKALCDSICVEHFSIDCELNSNANKFSSSKKCDNSRNETVFFFSFAVGIHCFTSNIYLFLLYVRNRTTNAYLAAGCVNKYLSVRSSCFSSSTFYVYRRTKSTNCTASLSNSTEADLFFFSW